MITETLSTVASVRRFNLNTSGDRITVLRLGYDAEVLYADTAGNYPVIYVKQGALDPAESETEERTFLMVRTNEPFRLPHKVVAKPLGRVTWASGATSEPTSCHVFELDCMEFGWGPPRQEPVMKHFERAFLSSVIWSK